MAQSEKRLVDVLIVDDDFLVARSIARLLARNCEVRIAGGIAEALYLVGRRVPDVIVSDLEMPSPTVTDMLVLIAQRHPQTLLILNTAAPEGCYVDLEQRGVVKRVIRKGFDGSAEVLRSILARPSAPAVYDDTECKRLLEEIAEAIAAAASNLQGCESTTDPKQWTAHRQEAAHHLRAAASVESQLADYLERVRVVTCEACAGRGCGECAGRGDQVRIAAS